MVILRTAACVFFRAGRLVLLSLLCLVLCTPALSELHTEHDRTADPRCHPGSSCPDADADGHPCGPGCPCACCPGHRTTPALAADGPALTSPMAGQLDASPADALNPKEILQRIFHPPRPRA